jgi:hypothetical protein
LSHPQRERERERERGTDKQTLRTCLVWQTQHHFQKIRNIFFLLQIKFFLVFFYRIDVLISKISFKKLKKYYFNTFLSEKHFEKQHLPYS